MAAQISLRVGGEERSIIIDTRTILLDALRIAIVGAAAAIANAAYRATGVRVRNLR